MLFQIIAGEKPKLRLPLDKQLKASKKQPEPDESSKPLKPLTRMLRKTALEEIENAINYPPPAQNADKTKSQFKYAEDSPFSPPKINCPNLDDARNYLMGKGFRLKDFQNMPDITKEADWVLSLLSEKYLGPVLHGIFSATPALCMCTEPSANDRDNGNLSYPKSNFSGTYYMGTNIIVIDAYDIYSKSTSGAGTTFFRVSAICHELHHYLSKLQKNRPKLKKWFNEGMTEFFSVRLLAANNFTAPFASGAVHVSYKSEVQVVDLLSQLIGESVIKEAYFNGNWTALELAFDKAFGKNSFSKFTACEGPAEAEAFLQKNLKAANAVYALWDKQPESLGARSKAEAKP